MHELSLAEDLIEQLTQAAASEQALRVKRVTVTIGKYSGVEPDAFEFAFPFAAEGTVVEGAELVIQELPITVECRICHATSHPEPTQLACSKCHSDDVELKGGREFLIQSAELEIPNG